MTTYDIYHPGETYKCQTLVYFNDILVDPTSITCEVLDPAGTTIATGAMTKESLGTYTFKTPNPLAADALRGKWTAVFTATNSAGDIETEPLHFIVENPQSTTIE